MDSLKKTNLMQCKLVTTRGHTAGPYTWTNHATETKIMHVTIIKIVTVNYTYELTQLLHSSPLSQ